MRIRVFSDLHLEHAPWQADVAGADLVVAAGDIGHGEEGARWLARLGVPVVYVAGNHEHWGGELAEAAVRLRAACAATPVRFLEREAAVLGGVRFLGCTLWADYRGLDPAVVGPAERGFNDFRRIRAGGRPLRVADLVAEHRRARAWLEAALAEPFDGPTVVVTHHAPSYASWPGGDKPARYACASDLETLVRAAAPALWVHGHIHHRLDYRIGATRVVCNPRGYAGSDPGVGWDPCFTVELETARPLQDAGLKGAAAPLS